MSASVEEIIANADTWQPEMGRLREVLLEFNLVEEVKWRQSRY